MMDAVKTPWKTQRPRSDRHAAFWVGDSMFIWQKRFLQHRLRAIASIPSIFAGILTIEAMLALRRFSLPDSMVALTPHRHLRRHVRRLVRRLVRMLVHIHEVAPGCTYSSPASIAIACSFKLCRREKAQLNSAPMRNTCVE